MDENTEIKGIGEVISTKSTPKIAKNVGERHMIVGDIWESLKSTSYKKISLPFLGELLKIYETEYLYDLHSRCKSAKNYAGLFWYHVKPKKV